MLCQREGQDPEASELSPTTRHVQGTCSFTARRVLEANGDRGGGPQPLESAQFMLLDGLVCPDQTDRRYVPTYDVSPDAFSTSYRTWQRSSSSNSEFLMLLNRLKDEGHLSLDSTEADNLRKAVNAQMLLLQSVSRVTKTERAIIDTDSYALFFRDQDVHPNRYVVYVGANPGREQVIAISPAFR